MPLTEVPWDTHVAETTISNILDRCTRDFSPETLWPMPESEDWEAQTASSIYLGAMGTLWAMNHLRDYILRKIPFDNHNLAEAICEKYFHAEAVIFADYADANGVIPSYWLGESGILLVKSKLQTDKSEEIWEKQFSLIKNNIKNPTLEPLWGGTGSVIPVLFKLEEEKSESWTNLFIDHCQFMKDEIAHSDKYNCPIWIQDLYGQKRMLTGAGHGFVGNMYPFIRGRKFLPDDLSEWVLSSTVETVIKTASIEGNCCNWLSSLEKTTEGRPPFLVQWCHGAPGVIISLNNIPVGYSREFDDLLIKAGETIWEAGPLTKNAGLCHGTDGNGYAFLKLYTRTGNDKWLERARKFAMHAIEQTSGSYSLWEGDLGLACFLHACISEDDRFPLLDVY